MKAKILLAIDGSASSTNATKYVARLLNNKPDVSVTMFHVLAPIPPALLETGSAQAEPELERSRQAWEESELQIEGKLFKPLRNILELEGFRPEQVHCKYVAPVPESEIADEILNECEAEGYDTVVLGKRGNSTVDLSLTGGITEKVVKNARNLAVWIVE